MDEQTFIQQVKQRAGMRDDAAARRAIEAALSVLGEHLPARPALHAAEQLPGAVGAPLRRAEHGHPRDLDEIYAEVARREDVELGFGLEHTQAVCWAVVEAVDAPTARAFLADLPGDLRDAVTVERPATTPPAPTSQREGDERRTLASARRGSENPVSEAGSEASPRGAVAHADSVVRNTDPHGDTKLSSAGGKPEERGEHLSEADPGSERPLSSSED
jgi:uncharacterized protein (DUF2267 family)